MTEEPNTNTPLKADYPSAPCPPSSATPETDEATLRAIDIEGGGEFDAVHAQVAKRLEHERNEEMGYRGQWCDKARKAEAALEDLARELEATKRTAPDAPPATLERLSARYNWLRLEVHYGRTLACGGVFPASEIKAGQRWQGSGGTLVTVAGVDDNNVRYTWSEGGNQKSHSKSHFAFQCRYCLVLTPEEPATEADELINWLEERGYGWSLDHTERMIEARIWEWPHVVGRYRPAAVMPLAEMLRNAMRNLPTRDNED